MNNYEISDLVENEQVPDVQDNADYKGIVGRMAEAAKSKYGKLATGIATGLLAAGLYAANPGKAKAEEPAEASVTQEEGRRLPDLSDWTKLDGERYVDKFENIEGKETVQHAYKKDGKMLIVSYFEDNMERPYSFAIKDPNGNIKLYGNKNANAIYEQEVKGGEDITIKIDKYRP